MIASLAALAEKYWTGGLGRAGSVLHVALLPAEALFRSGVALRGAAYDRELLPVHTAPLPVISVGNIAVGGAGKTPFTHWIARTLKARGVAPAIIHGGYADDEPELHRRWSPDIPVVVDADRVRAVHEAAGTGAAVAVLDDAFQHRRLHRDLDIALVSAEQFDRRFRMLPRGPWREPLRALARADVVVATRKTSSRLATDMLATLLASRSGRPIVHAHLKSARWLHRGSVAAAPVTAAWVVAAIADPVSLTENVREAGGSVAGRSYFPDHHAYTDTDVASILRRAAGRPIVTTEKDWTKLDRYLDHDQVWVLAQDVIIERGADVLDAALARVVRET